MRVRPAYYLISSLHWFAGVLPMAVSVLLAQSRGLNLQDVALFMGVYALTVVLCELPSGALADALGRRRVFIWGSAVAVLSKAVFLLALDLPTFLLYGVLGGVARALGSGALEAWFIEALRGEEPAAELQPALATAGAFNLAAVAAATLFGSLLPEMLSFLPSNGVLTPLSSSVAASLLLQLLVLALTGLLVRDHRSSGKVRWSLARREFRGVLTGGFSLLARSRSVRLLLGVDLVVGVALTASETFWQPFFAGLLQPGAVADSAAPLAADTTGTVAFGVILAGSFLLGVVGNVAATRVDRLLGKRHALTAALFLLLHAGAFVLLAWQGHPALATGFFWLTYLARSGWSSPHQTLFNLAVTDGQRSVMLSLSSLSTFAGGFLGSMLLGPLAQRASIPVAWTAAAVLAALGTLAYAALPRTATSSLALAGPAEPVMGAPEPEPTPR